MEIGNFAIMKRKKYRISQEEINLVEEPAVAYGSPSIGEVLQGDFQSIDFLKKGLGARSIEAVMHSYEMTQQEMADTLHTNPKTLRNKIRESGKLDPLQGSLILAMAELYQKGEEAFGGKEPFLEWLHFPSPALGNVPPSTFLDTFQGIRLIMSEIESIQDGSFA